MGLTMVYIYVVIEAPYRILVKTQVAFLHWQFCYCTGT